MSEVKKPTPAQLRWLRAIASGKVVRSGHSWVNGLMNENGGGWPSKSNYVMTLALHDAGWIDQGGRIHEWPVEYRIVLTDAGRAAIAAATGAQT